MNNDIILKKKKLAETLTARLLFIINMAMFVDIKFKTVSFF